MEANSPRDPTLAEGVHANHMLEHPRFFGCCRTKRAQCSTCGLCYLNFQGTSADCGQKSYAQASSYSSSKDLIKSLTETTSFTLNAFLPANAKPCFKLPFLALIKANAIQYGVSL